MRRVSLTLLARVVLVVATASCVGKATGDPPGSSDVVTTGGSDAGATAAYDGAGNARPSEAGESGVLLVPDPDAGNTTEAGSTTAGGQPPATDWDAGDASVLSSDAEIAADAPATPLATDAGCSSDADCGYGQACVAGSCALSLCTGGSNTSEPPLGPYRLLEPFRDVLAGDGNALVAFSPNSGAATGGSWPFGASIVDVASGNFFGEPDEDLAVAIQGQSGLSIIRMGAVSAQIPLGFVPIAVAAGDADGDGIEEIVALGQAGQIALCHAPAGSCTGFALSGETGIDVAFGDIAGTGNAQPIFLVSDSNSPSTLVAWNTNSATNGQQETVEFQPSETLVRLASGDLMGTGVASILGLEDGGWFGLADDVVHVFTLSAGAISETGQQSVPSDATDIVAGAYSGGPAAGVFVLESSNNVQIYSGALSLQATLPIATTSASRIALADYQGISPAAVLQGSPQAVTGQLVPTAVLIYPPYSSQQSIGTSSISVGGSQSQSSTTSDSVGLTASLGIGFSLGLSDVAKATVSDKVSTSLTLTHSTTQTVTLSHDYRIAAAQGLSGPNNAAVMVASACYQAYTYQVSDPQNLLGGGSDSSMVLFVPVGGEQTVWSLSQYNSFAQSQTGLPVVSVPYSVGAPLTYPTQPQTLEGQPIPSSQLVLAGTSPYEVSDVASVGWTLTLANQQSNAQSLQTTVAALSAEVSVGPLSVDTDVSGTLGVSYTIALGQEMYFGGTVPPVMNLSADGYSFSPIVYEEPSGFYVVTYTVTP